jgi:hypothetical protein
MNLGQIVAQCCGDMPGIVGTSIISNHNPPLFSVGEVLCEEAVQDSYLSVERSLFIQYRDSYIKGHGKPV